MEKPDKVILLRTTGTEVALSADAAKLPRRIKILNWGDNPNCHQKRVNVGPLFAQCFAAATYPYRKVALDFEHNTFPGTAARKKEIERKYEIAASDTKAKRAGEGVRGQAAAFYREAAKKEADANELEKEHQKIQAVLDKATIRRSRARDAAKTPVPKDRLFAAAFVLVGSRVPRDRMEYRRFLRCAKCGRKELSNAVESALNAAFATRIPPMGTAGRRRS